VSGFGCAAGTFCVWASLADRFTLPVTIAGRSAPVECDRCADLPRAGRMRRACASLRRPRLGEGGASARSMEIGPAPAWSRAPAWTSRFRPSSRRCQPQRGWRCRRIDPGQFFTKKIRRATRDCGSIRAARGSAFRAARHGTGPMSGQPNRAGSMPFQPSGGDGAILAIHSSCAAFPTELRFFSLLSRESR